MARTAALGVAVAALCGLFAAPALAGWGRPVRFSPPEPLDLIPAQIGFSATGSAAVAFGVQNEDDPAISTAYVTQRVRGRIGQPRRVPHSQQVLDVAYNGTGFELLSGTSPADQSCCSLVQAIPLTTRGFGRVSSLLGGLAGLTLGHLVPLPGGQLLVAVATEHGVWVAQSPRPNHFGPVHQLAATTSNPQSLVATALSSGDSVVGWTAAANKAGVVGPRSIIAAVGSDSRAPRNRRVAFSAPAGHRIDEVAIAPGPSAATFAWVEHWFDAQGIYRSRLLVADRVRGSRPRVLSASGQLVSGVTFAGDQNGDQVLAWKVCLSNGSCTVRASIRRAGKRFGSPQRRGAIDPSQVPAVAVAPDGQALLGWIGFGRVFAVSAGRHARAFGAVHEVSHTSQAADLALEFGPSGQAIATWTQGLFMPNLLGAVYSTK